MSLGEKLIELRKSKQLSQEEVAEKLNVTRQTISKWETDASTPDFDKIIPLCKLYGITSDELLTGKKEEPIDVDSSKEKINNKENRAKGIALGVLLYFVSVVWIMISVPVLKMNPIVASAIFLLICGIATFVIIYTSLTYKKEETKEEVKQKGLIKQIDNVLGVLTTIIYLGISFITMAWHITWIIWLIYALVMEIIKLIFSLRSNDNEE